MQTHTVPSQRQLVSAGLPGTFIDPRRTRLLQNQTAPQIKSDGTNARDSCHALSRGVMASELYYSDRRQMASAAVAIPEPAAQAPSQANGTLLCTIATSDLVEDACSQITAAGQAGASAIEVRLDFYKDLRISNPDDQLQQLVKACHEAGLSSVFTCRAGWEGGKFQGSEEARLHILRQAAALGADHVDVELKAAAEFFAGHSPDRSTCRIILSHHDWQSTPDDNVLDALVGEMFGAGAHVAKVATTALDITDAGRMLALIGRAPGPVISLAMGERGQISRLLAPRWGAYLTFGALGRGQESAPGQAPLEQMRSLFRLPSQHAGTQVYGVVGNPIRHSRSPLLHNSGFQAAGHDAVYVPLLVDDLPRLMACPLGGAFSGLSITLPHKEAAVRLADEVDSSAANMGAANTLVRLPNGALKAYNTDAPAAIAAIEQGLRAASGEQASTSSPLGAEASKGSSSSSSSSPLAGRTVVVLGAGGSARAIVFGAIAARAHVVIVNRSRHRAEQLAAEAGTYASVADLQDLSSGGIDGDVLVNTTSVGMHPHVDDSPVGDKAVLRRFALVFDAIYTPMDTRLLQDARQAGCATVSGVEMFVGQALLQFHLFTGQEAPSGLFRRLVLEGLAQ